jgi:5-methylcytosine-specific restriction endonuclease McrA
VTFLIGTWDSRWLHAQLRLQRGRCHWCGLVMNITDRLSPRYRSVEHICPRSKGGQDDPDNLMLACRSCNTRKGASGPAPAIIKRLPVATGPGWWLREYIRRKRASHNTGSG